MEEVLVAGHDYRVLSVKPPWAWAIMFGGKTIEYRSWATSYRGRILIHASGKRAPESQREALRNEVAQEYRIPLARVPADFEASVILGSVELVDCVEQGPGDVEWVLRDVRPLATPLRDIKGKLKVWHWIAEVAQRSGTRPSPSRTASNPATPPTVTLEPSQKTERNVSVGDLDTNTVMASFRSVATLEGKPELDLLREASRQLGFARMGARVEAALKAQLRTAMKRKLLRRQGSTLKADTRCLADYDAETLATMAGSLVRRGQTMERRELSMTLLQHLGFQMPDNTNGHEAASALDAAVSNKVLVAEGSKLWRVG